MHGILSLQSSFFMLQSQMEQTLWLHSVLRVGYVDLMDRLIVPDVAFDAGEDCVSFFSGCDSKHDVISSVSIPT